MTPSCAFVLCGELVGRLAVSTFAQTVDKSAQCLLRKLLLSPNFGYFFLVVSGQTVYHLRRSIDHVRGFHLSLNEDIDLLVLFARLLAFPSSGLSEKYKYAFYSVESLIWCHLRYILQVR